MSATVQGRTLAISTRGRNSNSRFMRIAPESGMPEPSPARGRRVRLWDPAFPFPPARAPFFYGWVIVAVGTMAVVFSIPGQTMGFSVFTDVLIVELGLSRVELSSAYFIGTVMSGLTLPYFGRMFDRLGARRMVVGASVATGLVLFYLSAVRRMLDGLDALLPVSRTVLAFVLITIGFYMIRASAQGVLTMAGRNAIGKWFDYYRGTAFAVSGLVTSFAFSFAPRGLLSLTERFGWSGAWFVLGVASIVLMATVGWLLLRDNPEECGLAMDGLREGGAKKVPHADAVAHRDYSRAEAIRTWPFWAFNLSFAFVALYTTAVTFHIVSIGEGAGIGKVEVLGFFVPMAVVSVLSNLAMGWVSSRTRLKYLLIVMNTAGLASVIGVIHLEHTVGVWAYIVGNGICGGGFACLTGIAWPRFFGRGSLGAISGVGMSSMVIASGVGPLLFSGAQRLTGAYSQVLWVCALLPAALVVGAIRADNPQRAKTA